jgi:hypothetical protein
MSEYRYYEFLAIDRPLDQAAQEALRSISSRARITATSFTNHYEWGDLKGDPSKFVEQWFDLHLYLGDWGERRLMIRLPTRLVDRGKLMAFLAEVDWVEISASGDNLVVDIAPDALKAEEDWDDGSGWLAELAPLRADVLSGDLRLFYLLWLAAVQDQLVADHELEPLAGIGPLTEPLKAFAAFFAIDPDLVKTAAELSGEAGASGNDLRETVAAIPRDEMIELLLRAAEGDAHVAAELRKRARASRTTSMTRRTVGALRVRAREIAEARERAELERREAERLRQRKEAEKARRARLQALSQRGEAVWRDVETEIERRNGPGYDRAAGLLLDLEALAREQGGQAEFSRRLASIRVRHEKKGKFIERLAAIERDNDGEIA